MQLLKQPPSSGKQKLVDRLKYPLKAGRTVMWLISGGSNIILAAGIMQDLLGREKNLIITLVDERYGPVGHADSNWQQLLEAGFDPGVAAVFPVLQDGLSLEATADRFNQLLADNFNKADDIVGQLGMGSDGHTSGILPNSPAAETTERLAIGYQTPGFNRVTTTFTALHRLHTAFCFVYGDDKRFALEMLTHQEIALTEQPAQIFKQMSEVYVYNDQVGDA